MFCAHIEEPQLAFFTADIFASHFGLVTEETQQRNILHVISCTYTFTGITSCEKGLVTVQGVNLV